MLGTLPPQECGNERGDIAGGGGASLFPAVIEEASTTRCRVAPTASCARLASPDTTGNKLLLHLLVLGLVHRHIFPGCAVYSAVLKERNSNSY